MKTHESGWHTAGRIAWIFVRILASFSVMAFAVMLVMFLPHERNWTDPNP